MAKNAPKYKVLIVDDDLKCYQTIEDTLKINYNIEVDVKQTLKAFSDYIKKIKSSDQAPHYIIFDCFIEKSIAEFIRGLFAPYDSPEKFLNPKIARLVIEKVKHLREEKLENVTEFVDFFNDEILPDLSTVLERFIIFSSYVDLPSVAMETFEMIAEEKLGERIEIKPELRRNLMETMKHEFEPSKTAITGKLLAQGIKNVNIMSKYANVLSLLRAYEAMYDFFDKDREKLKKLMKNFKKQMPTKEELGEYGMPSDLLDEFYEMVMSKLEKGDDGRILFTQKTAEKILILKIELLLNL